MTPEAYARLTELFGQAIDLALPERLALLAQVRADDPALAAELAALLEADASDSPEVHTGALVQNVSPVELAVPSPRPFAGGTMPGPREQPLPERIGPYDIISILGEGGMGVVYAARERTTGTRVALKTVPVAQESLLSSMRRESHALSRLRHPGVVRVLATGVDAGLPWYAMELLEGATLGALRNQLWGHVDDFASTYVSEHSPGSRPTVPIAPRAVAEQGAITHAHHGTVAGGQLARVLTVIRRLLTTLAYVHGEGIVHRDLKPTNVFLLNRDRPVLVDFGLASRSGGTMGREVLDLATDVVGTPAYMAPEQIRGDFVDSRADLYALGCVLYELLAGTPPFSGPTSVIMEHHLVFAPSPLSARVDGCPPALDALVLALLEKRPRDRIGHAEDVIQALDALGAEPEPTLAPRPRAYVYRPSLAGREAALEQLARAAEAAQRGRGGCVLIGGASGIGKTYLAMEAARATTSFRIISGTCALVGTFHHGPGGQPLHPFARLFQIIADRCTAEGRPEADRLLGARGKILAAHEPMLARLPGQDAYPDPPPLHGAAARDRLLTALADTLAALATEQPLLLLLDDLQWADEVSLRLLTMLGDDWFAKKRILVLGTYRIEETTAGITELLSRPYTQQVQLTSLDLPTVRAIACDMLAVDALPESFVEFLAHHSGGNAFFVAEYLRCATAEGLLRRGGHDRLRASDSRPLDALALPRSLPELVGRRLDGLSPDARTLASVGGVIGRELDPEILRVAAGLGDVESMEAISELIARQVLEQTDAGALRFTHDKLCEIAYERLPDAQRRTLHFAVADAIERGFSGSGDAPRFYSILAHHYLAARVTEKAIDFLERAGQRALSLAAYAEALDLHTKLLALDDQRGAPDLRRRARWERRLGETSWNLGDLAGTDKHTAAAMKRFGRPVPTTPRARAAGLIRLIGEQVLHRFGLNVRRPDSTGDRDDRAEVALAASIMAWRYFFAEDAAGVLCMALRAVNETEAAAPPIPLPYGYAWLGYATGIARAHRLARFYFDQSTAKAIETGDMAGKHFGGVLEVAYHLSFGHWDDVSRVGRAALAELHAAGDPTNAELHMTGLANVAYFTAHYAESERIFEQILLGARARRNLQHEAWGLFGRAIAMVARGRFDESLERLTEAKQILAPLGDTASLVVCDGLRSSIYARRGEDVAGREAADEIRARLSRTGIGIYTTIHGNVGAAEGYLELAVRKPGDTGLLREARAACEGLRRFSHLVPIAVPAALRYQGQLLALEGQPRRARRAFARSLDAARRLRMPYDEACALWLAARFVPERGRDARFEEAARIFRRIDCAWHLEQAQRHA